MTTIQYNPSTPNLNLRNFNFNSTYSNSQQNHTGFQSASIPLTFIYDESKAYYYDIVLANNDELKKQTIASSAVTLYLGGSNIPTDSWFLKNRDFTWSTQISENNVDPFHKLPQLPVQRAYFKVFQDLTQPSIEEISGDKISPHLTAVNWIKNVTGLSDDRLGQILDVDRQTVIKWKKGGPINDTNLQRLLVVREVLERANRKYSTPERLVEWLYTPRGLEGKTPFQLLEDGEINKARFYAVSQQSRNVLRPRFNVERDLPQVWENAKEQREKPYSLSELSSFSDEEE